jgi:hypothetical protein
MARVLSLWEERHIKEMSMKRQERLEQKAPSMARQTLERAADVVECFDRPCLLGSTALAMTLEARGREIVALGAKDRADRIQGFRLWDVRRPSYIEQAFDLVLCDAMDASVSLAELRQAIRVLTHFQPKSPLIVACPASRKDSLLRVFADFGLEATGFRLNFEKPETLDGEEVEFFANFDLPI